MLTTSYTEAYLCGPVPQAGSPGEVLATEVTPVGTVAFDQFGNEYVFVKGVASGVEGFAVTFDEAGVTTALAANAKGPVAWLTGALVAGTYGWAARKGQKLLALVAANTADNALLGRETTDGYIGDGRAAGDEIYGVISRAAVDATAALSAIQVYGYPYVDDANGA